MSRVASRAYKVTILSLMIALVYVFELVNRALPLRVPWGMSIDFVALPVMIAFFVLGTRYAVATGVGMYLILIIFGFANFVGATMKFASTIAMVLVLGLVAFIWSRRRGSAALPVPVLLPASALALAARCLVAALLNYYWAIPIFLAMPIEEVINTMFFGSIWGFLAFVSSMNLVQGAIDLALSWTISLGLARRSLSPTLSASSGR